MTDKKQPGKRPVAMPRLFKSIDEMVSRTDELSYTSTVNDLLDTIKDAWFKAEMK